MSEARLEAGDPVVLVDEKGRYFYDWLAPGGHSNVRGDLVSHDEIIGHGDGGTVGSRRGRTYRVLSATLVQHVQHMPKHTSLIFPKDAALLATWGDVFPGALVVEGGLGSGALTLSLLRAVGPTGRVVTYELREESVNRARKNIRALLGETPNHEVRHADIYQGIEERDVDSVILDVPEPWDVVPHAAAALRPGGVFASYVVGTTQIQRLVIALERIGCFALIECLESLVRPWQVSARSVRPDLQMVGHTGFLVFARRTAAEPRAPREEAPTEPVDEVEAVPEEA
jgi:tRNA (adenine57-N1/adenine58-N1)-methyltransferase